jgi:hypothetical protein
MFSTVGNTFQEFGNGLFAGFDVPIFMEFADIALTKVFLKQYQQVL